MALSLDFDLPLDLDDDLDIDLCCLRLEFFELLMIFTSTELLLLLDLRRRLDTDLLLLRLLDRLLYLSTIMTSLRRPLEPERDRDLRRLLDELRRRFLESDRERV